MTGNKPVIDVKPETLLNMAPMELVKFLNSEFSFSPPSSLRLDSANAINEQTAFIGYFAEMELRARLLKKEKGKEEKEERERLLSTEEVFRTFKEVAKANLESVAKQMTLRRLDIDEAKIFGRRP